MTTYDYPFTETEMETALRYWGCNCGPSALAFALQRRLSDIRDTIPGFEEKRYTSPSMMKAALGNLGVAFFNAVAERENMFRPQIALVRVQWSGPWTTPGANAKWAYTHTHWIAAWLAGESLVFDCNGGIQSFACWEKEIVPALTNYPRADGGWYPTHVWRLTP